MNPLQKLRQHFLKPRAKASQTPIDKVPVAQKKKVVKSVFKDEDAFLFI